MYTVVVCSNCRYCWIVKDRPDRTKCGRCQKSHQFGKLRKFHTTDNQDEAKRARSTVRAEVIGDTERFKEAQESGVLDVDIDHAVDIEEYLKGKGLNLDELDDVEERASEGVTTSTRSRREIIQDAIRGTDAKTETEIIKYAVEHDVSEENAERTLQKLRERGTVIQTSNGFRIV